MVEKKNDYLCSISTFSYIINLMQLEGDVNIVYHRGGSVELYFSGTGGEAWSAYTRKAFQNLWGYGC